MSSTYQATAPDVTDEFIRQMVLKLYGIEVSNIKALVGYDDKNYLLNGLKKSSNVKNDKITNEEIKNGCVFKITAPSQAVYQGLEDAQISVLQHCYAKNVPCPHALPQLDGQLVSRQEITQDTILPVRLLTYLPGKMMRGVPVTETLMVQIGGVIAQFTEAMKDFTHPFFSTYTHLWSYHELHKCRDMIHHFEDAAQRETFTSALNLFRDNWETSGKQLPQSVIHSDFNEGNLVVNDDFTTILGIIDFGDVVQSPTMFEWTTPVMYFMLEACAANSQVNFKDVGRIILNGYRQHKSAPKISQVELKFARTAMIGRLSQSLICGYAAYKANPSNSDYLLHTQKTGWTVLKYLMDMSDEQFAETLS